MGGMAGAPPCSDSDTGDDACASGEGGGSLCVGGTCTKATGQCNAKLLVVVEHGRTVDDAALAGACHFRDLDGARAAIAEATERLALYIDSAASTAALRFEGKATLDGHAADASKAVALTLPPTSAPALVSFAQGGELRGVALDGGGKATAARVESGTLSVVGPTTMTNAAFALELAGAASASVTGTATAPVRLADNRRGVIVPSAAVLTMQGDGVAEALVIEGTSVGAAVLFEIGTGGNLRSTLSKVTFRENVGLTGGAGAVEVRGERQVTLDGCIFERNKVSLNLSGGGSSLSGAFLGVTLTNNVFSSALPVAAPDPSGSIICGDNLGAGDTLLSVGASNVFPGDDRCADLGAESQFGCNAGQFVGHSRPDNPEPFDLKLTCVGTQ